MRFVVILVLLARSAAAEPSVGSLRGRVIDAATGEPAIGATVAALDRVAQLERAEITDERGEFVIGELPPGTYTVVVYYMDATHQRDLVVVAADKIGVVNMTIDTSTAAPSQVIQFTEPHMCCGGCPCRGGCGRTFGSVLAAAASIEEVAPPRAVRGPRLGLSTRAAAGVHLADGRSDATASFDLEVTYAVTRRIDLALAGGVALGDGRRWHAAAGVRLFASEHVFVQPQLTLPLGMSLLEGVTYDVRRAVAIYGFAAQVFDGDAGSFLGGAGVQARY